ncbi:hypothetical protein BC832DRAFT_561267 [Gaertneriomyces semiglobifer]|nr:hypothetical protein BC832DRAFT_561267 [Gaertneriomyces semiglobifer]
MRQRRRRGSVASLGTGREHSKISASRSSSANGRLPTGRRSSVSNSSQLKERRRQPRRSEGGGKWRWTMQGWVWVDKDGKEEVVDGGATSLLNDGTKHRRRASIKGEPAGSASVDVKGQERQNGTPKDQTDTADTRHMHTPDIPPSRVLSSPPSPQLNDTVQAAAALILLAANHRPDVAYPRTVDEDVLGPRSMNV